MTARWVLLLFILLAAIYMDATEPKQEPEHYPGDLYHDATGWHHECAEEPVWRPL